MFYVASIRERASDRSKRGNFARYSITSYNYKSKCLCKVNTVYASYSSTSRKDILKPPLRKVNAFASHSRPVHCETNTNREWIFIKLFSFFLVCISFNFFSNTWPDFISLSIRGTGWAEYSENYNENYTIRKIALKLKRSVHNNLFVKNTRCSYGNYLCTAVCFKRGHRFGRYARIIKAYECLRVLILILIKSVIDSNAIENQRLTNVNLEFKVE